MNRDGKPDPPLLPFPSDFLYSWRTAFLLPVGQMFTRVHEAGKDDARKTGERKESVSTFRV